METHVREWTISRYQALMVGIILHHLISYSVRSRQHDTPHFVKISHSFSSETAERQTDRHIKNTDYKIVTLKHKYMYM